MRTEWLCLFLFDWASVLSVCSSPKDKLSLGGRTGDGVRPPLGFHPLLPNTALAGTGSAPGVETKTIRPESPHKPSSAQAELPDEKPEIAEQLIVAHSEPKSSGPAAQSHPSHVGGNNKPAVPKIRGEQTSHYDPPYEQGAAVFENAVDRPAGLQSHLNLRSSLKAPRATLSETRVTAETHQADPGPESFEDSIVIGTLREAGNSNKSAVLVMPGTSEGAPRRELLLEKAPGVLTLVAVFNQFLMRPRAEGGNGRREAADREARDYVADLIANFWSDLLTDPPLEHRRKRPLTLEVE